MAKEKSKSQAPRIALVGGETLLGHEIQEVLKSRLDHAKVTAYAANGEGTFDEEDGEAVYREHLQANSIQDDRAVLVAGNLEGARKAYELVKAVGGRQLLIDCTGQLDQSPEAAIVAPQLEGPSGFSAWLCVLAHPAAVAILLALRQSAFANRYAIPSLRCLSPLANGESEGHRNCINRLLVCSHSNHFRRKYSMRRLVSICCRPTAKTRRKR